MKTLPLLLFFLLLTSAALFAQQQQEDEVVVARPSRLLPLRHEKSDSLSRVRPDFVYLRRRLQYMYIENPAVRYSLENLKTSNDPLLANDTLNQAIHTIVQYLEDQEIKYMLEQVRSYLSTMAEKENALKTIQEQLLKRGLSLPKDTLPSEQIDTTLLEKNLEIVLTYIKEDENYRWLREKSRDSVMLTILNASNQMKDLWLNTGKGAHYKFNAENLLGDTIDTWIQVFPKGNMVKFHFPENVYQIKKGRSRTLEVPLQLSYPERPIYSTLVEMRSDALRRKYWTYYTDMTLSFGQGYISENWAGGGESSFSLLSDIKYFINYKKNNVNWENAFRYRVGALKRGKEKLSKNEDKLEVLSKLGLKAFKYWNYAAQFDFSTVLFTSYNYPQRQEIVANLLTPAYFTLSVGFDYKPNNKVSLYFSPIAGKWTYVRDTMRVKNTTRYGVEKGKKLKSAAGAKIDFKNNHTLFDFLELEHRLIVFASYYDDPVTVDWRLTPGFKINSYLKTSINLNMMYDRNNSKKIQFKETLSLDIYLRF
jgi:hypothetical protein